MIAYEAIPDIAAIITHGDERLIAGVKSCVSDYKKYYAEHGAEFAKNNLPVSAESGKLMTCWAALINGLLDGNYAGIAPEKASLPEIQTALAPVFPRHGQEKLLEQLRLGGEEKTRTMLEGLGDLLHGKNLRLCNLYYIFPEDGRHVLFVANQQDIADFHALEKKYRLIFRLCEDYGVPPIRIRNSLQMLDTDSFYGKVDRLIKENKNRDLETYLRALYGIVRREREKDMTGALFFSMLEEAYTADAVPFEKSWLIHTEAPDEDAVQGIDYAIAVIEFQIAELHRMAGKQLENEYKCFGIDSETGNRWYNFDPHANLECGARGLGFAGTDDETPETADYSWRLLGELLETGRYYE